MLPLILLACTPKPADRATDTATAVDTADTATDTAVDTAPDSPEDTAPDTDTAGPVVPTEDGSGRWTFASGDLTLVVDATVGSRVTTLSLGGVDLLTGPDVDPSNYGATVWTSPQSAWGWPPPAAIDSAPYTASLDGAVLRLQSGGIAVGGGTLTLEKAISVTGSTVTATYTYTNVDPATVSVAGWQVTRVPSGGLTVFPSGEGLVDVTGSLPRTDAAGATWISGTPSADAKIAADGAEGWIAQITGGVALRVDADDITAANAAPGEGEIEVYARGGGGYVEVERQSAMTALAAGESLTWTVTWTVAPVPDGLDPSPGSADLLAFLRTL